MEEIKEALEVKRKVEAEARQSFWNNRGNNRKRTGNEDKKQPGNRGKAGKATVPHGGGIDLSKNMCKNPVHKHRWNECQEDRFCKNYKDDDLKGCGKGGENHSIVQKDECHSIVRFEDLSKTRQFKGTFEIIPTGALSNASYGVFSGSAMMQTLGIDTSIIANTISWGKILLPRWSQGVIGHQ